MKGLVKYIFCTFCLLFVSCNKDRFEGESSLILNFSTEAIQTKAGAATGDIINNIRVFIVNSDEKVAATSYSNSFSSGRVEISGINSGVYTLYAIANDPKGEAFWSSCTKGSTFSDTYKKSVLDLSGNEPIFSESAGMPLSVVEKDVIITSGLNVFDYKLERLCSRIRVFFGNKTNTSDNRNIQINSFSFSNKNPNKSYLFNFDSSTPSGLGFSGFKPYTSSSVDIAPGEEKELYSTYLFESTNITGFTFNCSGKLVGVKDFTIPTKDVVYIDKYGKTQTLSSLPRNTELDLLINIYYSPNLKAFSFEFKAWENKSYETTFD